jgi:hypothetical protein
VTIIFACWYQPHRLALLPPVVLDRSFVSKLVHGPLDRGHSRLTFG